MKQSLKLVYYAIVGFLIIASLLLVFSIIPIANFRIKNVLSGSMEPAIGMGSIVVMRGTEEYQVGDIITFQFLGEIPTTHRIYDVKIDDNNNRWFITKGDANEEPDSKMVYERDIIGRVLFHIPYLGFVVNFFQQPLGFILLIVVPATIIISDEIRNIIKEIEKLKNKNKKFSYFKDKLQDKKIQKIEEKDKRQDVEIKDLKQAIIELKNEKDEIKLKTKNYTKKKKMIKNRLNNLEKVKN